MYLCMYNIVGKYCIVLYLYIYIAFLEVHTNQKLFSVRPRFFGCVIIADGDYTDNFGRFGHILLT